MTYIATDTDTNTSAIGGITMPSVIKNFTPHTVTLGGVTYASQGVARVGSTDEIVGHLYQKCPIHTEDPQCGCSGLELPIVRQTLGEVDGLPAAEAGTLIIVSRMVAAAQPGRTDLVCPARLTRDAEGRITGCEALESLSD